VQVWNIPVTISLRQVDKIGSHLEEVSIMESTRRKDSTPAQNSNDATMMVSMFDEQLVICAPTHLDLEMTRVLVIAAASALACGTTVMIDLDPETASDELIARRPLSNVATECFIPDDGPVNVLSAGYVQLTTRDGYWTIDLSHGRLCRSNDAIEPHFVGLDDWVEVSALWVTPTSVTALTRDGTYVSAFAAWTSEPRSQRLTPA
jgi:hypothetical protein